MGHGPMTAPSQAGFVHEALLYHDDAELRDALREFVVEAAGAGEAVLVALPGEHLSNLQAELAHAAPDSRFEDMQEVGRNPRRLLPMICDWVDAHGGRARVVAEAIWPGRSYPETAECLRHEAMLNTALAGTDASVLCPFDAERLDDHTLAGAEMTHPTVRESGSRRPSAAYQAPEELRIADDWPLEVPTGPVSEHALDGSLSALRQAVAEDPLLAVLSPERQADLVFAMNEAATNAVRHGDGRCVTRLWHDGRSVVSEVSSGIAFDDAPAGRRRPDPDADSGRGLWLINEVCDLVELRSDGDMTTLRMHVRDRAPQTAPV